MDAAARLEAVHDRHAQIQEDDVGLELTGEPARLVAVVRAPRNLDLRLDAENGLERVQEKRIVVRDEDAHRKAQPVDRLISSPFAAPTCSTWRVVCPRPKRSASMRSSSRRIR